MSIWQESLATGQTAMFGSTAPNITSTGMMSATFTFSRALIIDNSQFSYEIYAGLYAATPNLGFRGARIGYTCLLSGCRRSIACEAGTSVPIAY